MPHPSALRRILVLLVICAALVGLQPGLAGQTPSALAQQAQARAQAVPAPAVTTNQPDGYHELTAVAYEGSHVRTQKRVAQTVRLQNTPLSAVFTTLYGGSNTLVGATLQFSVVANTNNIAKIELFSTGGSLGSVANQSNATFSVAGTNLDLGLHPFYALVTGSDGKQYRTETRWIRLIGPDSPFSLSLKALPPVLGPSLPVCAVRDGGGWHRGLFADSCSPSGGQGENLGDPRASFLENGAGGGNSEIQLVPGGSPAVL